MVHLDTIGICDSSPKTRALLLTVLKMYIYQFPFDNNNGYHIFWQFFCPVDEIIQDLFLCISTPLSN